MLGPTRPGLGPWQQRATDRRLLWASPCYKLIIFKLQYVKKRIRENPMIRSRENFSTDQSQLAGSSPLLARVSSFVHCEVLYSV